MLRKAVCGWLGASSPDKMARSAAQSCATLAAPVLLAQGLQRHNQRALLHRGCYAAAGQAALRVRLSAAIVT